MLFYLVSILVFSCFTDKRTKDSLVSALLKEGRVSEVEVFSEAGMFLKIILPWESATTMKNNNGTFILNSNLVELNTEKGEYISFKPKI